MSVTITAATGATSTPITVLSPYSTQWESRNVVHDLAGGGIAVSLITPRPRSGVLELLFADETLAYECVWLHMLETTFTLTETTRPHVSMTYVAVGTTDVRLDPDTLTMFIVAVNFQEVIL